MCRFHNNGGLHRTSGDAPLKHMTLGGERESTPYWPMISYARRMVRRGQSYAVDSKRSIDLKTQFVTHVLIRYSVLPRPSFINKWFRRGLEVSSSWGESRNTLRIHQWFCMLEGWLQWRNTPVGTYILRFSRAGGVYKRYFWASASSETCAPGGSYFAYSVFLGVTLACLMDSLKSLFPDLQ